MAFAFEPMSDLDAEVRRVGCERLDQAIAELTAIADREADDVAAAVHSVRKRCKELRALARLVTEPLGAEQREFDALVRGAAEELAGMRDAHAMLATLDNLRSTSDATAPGAETDPDLAAVHHIHGIHASLTAQATARLHGDDPTITNALERLVEARNRCAAWQLDSTDWLASGIAATYRDGRRAMRRAGKRPTDERMHDWRKRVKRLWYQVRLIEQAAPGALGPLIARLDDLGETLGDHHDLSVLIERLESTAKKYGGKRRVARACTRARAEQDALAKRAFRLGAGIYGERTPAFTARLMHYWKTAVELGPEPVSRTIADLVADDRRERRGAPAAAAATATATAAAAAAATIERERKYLVSRLPDPADLPDHGVDLRQGYLAIDGTVSVRVRDAGPGGYTMTVKGGRGAVRTELEWELTAAEFEAAWAHTEKRRITKTRYRVPLDPAEPAGKLMVDLDVFHGELEGLALAEVEFDSDTAMAAFAPPDWFGPEVTDDPRFANASLATQGSLGRLRNG